MIYFTADPHLYHTNCIRFCQRPFSTIDDYHTHFVKHWNTTITNEDEVYILGDFVWPKGTDISVCSSLVKSLNGDKHIIPGDHDFSNEILKSFGLVVHDKIHILAGFKDLPPIILCHWPLRNWPMSHYGAWHLFGHIHNNNKSKPFDEFGKSFNIGIDVWDYKLVSLTEIVNKMNSCEQNYNLLKKDGIANRGC